MNDSLSSLSIVVKPLLPPITYLDIILPPLLIALSLLLHTINNAEPIDPEKVVSAHLYRATTAHARFLPVEAKHVFSYPVLFFGIDLEALESGSIDLGKLFRWKGNGATKGWSLTGLDPAGYLDIEKGDRGIREKLLAYLMKAGVAIEHATRIYTVTMPSYLGFEGINPLTIHYCYSESEEGSRQLQVVVLEVHNTFGERHIYLLKTAVDEDLDVALGFEHQWTFPRAFHVSPFNDRTGFYRVSLSDPLATLTSPRFTPHNPTLTLKIVFLTPDLTKKIYASLGGPGVPLTDASLLSSLLRFPLSLLLTTPRILYQAMKLHYSKKLDVFPRPEPFVTVGGSGEVNPVQSGGREGAVGWVSEEGTDKIYKDLVLAQLQLGIDRCGEGVAVRFIPAGRTSDEFTITPSASKSMKETTVITVDYLTPMVWSDLVTLPTLEIAFGVGSRIEQRWTTSNDAIFLSLLNCSDVSTAVRPSIPTRMADSIRWRQFKWSASFSSASISSVGLKTRLHPIRVDTMSLLVTMMTQFLIVRIGYCVFVLAGARFVRGMETWMEGARWMDAEAQVQSAELVRDDEKRIAGSVLRL